MLRDPSLIPLSRQHQHALALCVRIDRASPVPDRDLAVWQAEMTQHFEQEIKIHFAAEEQVLFPHAGKFTELAPLVNELVADHAALRELFCHAEALTMSATQLQEFARRLSSHIRKEERQLFESLQERMTGEQLAHLGKQLDTALVGAAQSCALPAPATTLPSPG
jgi:iron-sulfur cluster repair protein YtfE (RIC family)